MPTLTIDQIYGYALAAGFPPDRATIFAAIAMAESGGRTDARNPDGEDSRGLWQVNVDPDVRDNTWGDLYDPLTNARAAFEISDGGRLLKPWSVTHEQHAGTARDYRTYLPDAQQAAANAGATPFVAAAGLPQGGQLLGSGQGLVQPVPGATLHDSWGEPRSGGRSHEGIDIMAPEGTPIHAISGGTVVEGFTNRYGGNVVRIEGDDGRYYYYAHLETVADLSAGQRVPTGAVIGTVGDTGNAAGTPPHLHLQIKQDGEWINPYDFLQGLADPAPAAAALYDVDTGVPPMAADGDEDGLTDEFELLLGTDPAAPDSDDDGLSDLYETSVSHTDPLSADTDDDDAPDALEVAEGTDAGTVPLPEAALAAGFGGGDTLDSDDDGLSDLYEVEHGLDPYSADTDEDSLPDALEVAHGSSPVSNDSDRDGIVDGWEHEFGTLEPVDALDPLSQAPAGSQEHVCDGACADHGGSGAGDLADGSGTALEDLAADTG